MRTQLWKANKSELMVLLVIIIGLSTIITTNPLSSIITNTETEMLYDQEVDTEVGAKTAAAGFQWLYSGELGDAGLTTDIVIDSTGIIHVVTVKSTLPYGYDTIVYSNSGTNFTFWDRIGTEEGNPNYLQLLCDSADVLHLFYTYYGTIYYRNSTDGFVARKVITDSCAATYLDAEIDASNVFHLITKSEGSNALFYYTSQDNYQTAQSVVLQTSWNEDVFGSHVLYYNYSTLTSSSNLVYSNRQTNTTTAIPNSEGYVATEGYPSLAIHPVTKAVTILFCTGSSSFSLNVADSENNFVTATTLNTTNFQPSYLCPDSLASNSTAVVAFWSNSTNLVYASSSNWNQLQYTPKPVNASSITGYTVAMRNNNIAITNYYYDTFSGTYKIAIAANYLPTYIQQVNVENLDYVYYGITTNYLELQWTAWLTSALTADHWDLYHDNGRVLTGNYTSTTPVTINVTAYIDMPGMHNFTVMFYANDTESVVYQKRGILMVECYDYSTNIQIQQISSIDIMWCAPLTLNWTAIVPSGYTPTKWELWALVGGGMASRSPTSAPSNVLSVANGTYTNNVTVYVNVTDFCVAPLVTFAMDFYATNARNYEITSSCDIRVNVIGMNFSIAQIDYLEVEMLDKVVLNWTAWVPSNTIPYEWQLYADLMYSYRGTLKARNDPIANGTFQNGVPVSVDVSAYLTYSNILFTMVFIAHNTAGYPVTNSCAISVYITNYSPLAIQHIDELYVIENTPVVLNWTAFIFDDSYTPSGWNLYSGEIPSKAYNAGKPLASGNYTSGVPIFVNVTDYLPTIGNYTFTMVCDANNGELSAVCEILVIVIPRPLITITQINTTQITFGQTLTLEWTASVINGTASTWTLWQGESAILTGNYTSGVVVSVDVTSYLTMAGKYTFTMVFHTSEGLSASCTITVTVLPGEDTTPPIVTVIRPTNGSIIDPYTPIHFTAVDPESAVVSVICRWNATPDIAFTWAELMTINAPLYGGTYFLKIKATNEDGYSATYVFKFIVKENIVIVITEPVANVSVGAVNLTISVSAPVNITITALEQPPAPLPANLGSVGIFIEVTISDPDLFGYMWINVTLAEMNLPAGTDPKTLRVYYYNEKTELWEAIPESGYDAAREVVWARVNHLSCFSVVSVASTATTGDGSSQEGIPGFEVFSLAIIGILVFTRRFRQSK